MFVVPRESRDENIRLLWEAEREVFASEFNADARAYRKKHNSPFGIAAMVQPVVGRNFGKYFCPLLAGSAYVSYEGKRLIRVCIGLGVKAVDSKALVINKNLPTRMDLDYCLGELGQAVVINTETGQLEEVSIPEEAIHSLGVEPLVKLWEALRLIESSGNYYLEWATPDSNPANLRIVQAAPFQDKLACPITIETEGKVILAQGTDIVNHGVKKCQAVVRAGLCGWTRENTEWLKYLNDTLKDYLLIVPQTGFSGAGPLVAYSMDGQVPTLGYSHFSNAAALLELTYDSEGNATAGIPSINHTGGRGGQHFQQVCSREDILFIGAQTDLEALHGLECCAKFDRCIKVYQVPVEVINDVTTGQGTIYICGSAVVPEYSVTEIQDFADVFYETAREAEKNDPKIAESMYCACHCLPVAERIIDFDPFAVDEEMIGRYGKAIIVGHLEKVLAEGYMWFDNNTWDYGKIQTYLRQLVTRLRMQEANAPS